MNNESDIDIPVVNIPNAAATLFVTIICIFINLIVLIGLKGCDLSDSTRLLMRCQIFGNCIGLTGIFLYHKVIFTGQHFAAEHTPWNGLPGAFSIAGIYVHSVFLLFMAANRYISKLKSDSETCFY